MPEEKTQPTFVNYYYNSDMLSVTGIGSNVVTTTIPAYQIDAGGAWVGTVYNNVGGNWGGGLGIKLEENDKGKISPQLYFNYIKKKFGFLERPNLDRRLKKIEAAFDEAVESKQNVLAEKILNNLVIEMRESAMFAKGITHYIERDTLNKHKRDIKGGHISDTLLKDYTRVIPSGVKQKIKKVEGIFDSFVIYHYYEKAVEEKLDKKQKMTTEEKGKMRDPVVFGIIKETNKLYFIADWEDDFCDLTFDDIVDVIGEERISKNINLTK